MDAHAEIKDRETKFEIRFQFEISGMEEVLVIFRRIEVTRSESIGRRRANKLMYLARDDR